MEVTRRRRRRCRNCFLKQVIEGKIKEEMEVTRRRGRRRRNCLLKHVMEGKIDGKIEVTGRRREEILHGLEEKR
jgi:hypothetical protein